VADTKTRIDEIVTDHLGLKLTDPYVVDQWRPQLLRTMQKVLRLAVWNFTDWYFRYGKTTPPGVVVTAGTGPLPTDFAKIGSRGRVYWPIAGTQPRRLRLRDAERVFNYREEVGATAGDPSYYAIYGTNFEVEIAVSGNLTVYYEKTCPTLVDQVDPGSGLTTIPDDVQDALVLGVIDALSVPLGDDRGVSELSPRFRKALTDARQNHLPGLESEEQLADYGVGEMEMW